MSESERDELESEDGDNSEYETREYLDSKY